MKKKVKKEEEKKKISDATLLRQYRDPTQPGSLGGVQRFAKTRGISAGRARVLLQRDLVYTLHKPTRRRFPTLPVLVFGPDEKWAADLVEVQTLAKYNKGNRYLLCVIDVVSKYAWVEPLKSKTYAAVTQAFEKVLRRARGRTPLKLQTDDRKEFYNKTFRGLMTRRGIRHFSTAGNTKASVVERFNRTLKQRPYRYFTVKNTLSFVPVLPEIVQGYNRSHHRSIGMAPRDVDRDNIEEVWQRLYAKRGKRKPKRPALKVGDRVRLKKKHRTFKKSYLPGWTEEVFGVTRLRRGPVPTYKNAELDDTPVRGTFHAHDLQKVGVGDDDLFRVDRIVKRR